MTLHPPRTHKDPRRKQRGVALVLALVLLSLMTALVVDANTTARTRVLQAARYRDSTQARYLAQSGVRFYLLLLALGGQLKAMMGGSAQQVEDMLGVSLDDAMWQTVPFLDTAWLRMIQSGVTDTMDEESLQQVMMGQSGGGAPAPELSAKQAAELAESHEQDGIQRHGFLEFPGDFRAEIIPDEGGLNINNLVTFDRPGIPLRMNPMARALNGLFSRDEYKELFREELDIEPMDLVANIKDWADPDGLMSSALGGYEDKLYDEEHFPYSTKNARFLTLRELQLVSGMTDRAYGMFGPALTVWGKAININAASRTVLWGVVRGFAAPTLSDQQITDALNAVMELHLGILRYPKGNAGVNRFLAEIEAQGITWETPEARQTLARDVLTTKSEYFTIRSTGFVNETERTIEVSIRYMGRSYRVLQWREL